MPLELTNLFITDSVDVKNALSCDDGGIDFQNVIPLQNDSSTYEDWGCSGIMNQLSWNYKDGKYHIYFETYWNPPRKVILKLHEIFPTSNIEHYFVDEHHDYNGKITIVHHQLVEEPCPELFFDDISEAMDRFYAMF